jgi:hypothetical protein
MGVHNSWNAVLRKTLVVPPANLCLDYTLNSGVGEVAAAPRRSVGRPTQDFCVEDFVLNYLELKGFIETSETV